MSQNLIRHRARQNSRPPALCTPPAHAAASGFVLRTLSCPRCADRQEVRPDSAARYSLDLSERTRGHASTLRIRTSETSVEAEHYGPTGVRRNPAAQGRHR